MHHQSSAPPAHRTTRHHRVDHDFVALLEDDFGIARHALINAFMGVPAAPKREAIALCKWAVRVAPDDPARALLAWARKNRRGTFRPCEDDHAGDGAE